MKAIILAGGFGTRMGKLCDDIPKPMTLVCGKPVLQRQIEALKKEGVTEFILIVHHMADKITSYFKDGSHFGVKVSYFYEKEPLGTAGALFKLNLKEDFLLCNGDLIFDFSLNDMIAFHRKRNALATLFTHPNSHPYDSTLICAEENGKITALIQPNQNTNNTQNLCNAGIQIISPELLELHKINGKANLDKDIIAPAISTNRIFSYKSTEYVHDMGTPDRLKQVEKDLCAGIVKQKHKRLAQKAVFLDRDGTINVHKGFITVPEQIELIDGAAKAIKTFNQLGYLVIIITNQPVIARGECSLQQLSRIHNRLEMLLGNEGALIDAIYYCPHHTDKGFDGEIPELKIPCECRKPAPKMILDAQKAFNIDLSNSYMVGDSERDVQCAVNANCIPVFLSDKEHDFANTFTSLYEFSRYLSNK